jgi:hypothetical protein
MQSYKATSITGCEVWECRPHLPRASFECFVHFKEDEAVQHNILGIQQSCGGLRVCMHTCTGVKHKTHKNLTANTQLHKARCL